MFEGGLAGPMRPPRPHAAAAALGAAALAAASLGQALCSGALARASASPRGPAGPSRRLATSRRARQEPFDWSAGLADLDTAVAEAAESAEGGEGGWLGQRLSVYDLEVGQELEGVVQCLRPYGCFVDVGADREGLVHKSRMSLGFVEDVDEHVSPGQQVTVWVYQVDPDGTLGLSMVEHLARRPAPNSEQLDAGVAGERGVRDLEVGQELEGVVRSVRPYGCLVDVGVEREGLVHISLMSEGYVEDVGALAAPGQRVTVWVDELLSDGTLGLSMVERLGRRHSSDGGGRWQPAAARWLAGLPRTSWLTGTVAGIRDFGILVDVSPPRGRSGDLLPIR